MGLGNSFTVDMEPFPFIEKFVCALYKTNDARYKLFCSNSPVKRQLPPSQACQLQHVKRGTYQKKIWKLATTAMMNCLFPAGHGRTVSQELLSVHWMKGDAVPVCFKHCSLAAKFYFAHQGSVRVLPNN